MENRNKTISKFIAFFVIFVFLFSNCSKLADSDKVFFLMRGTPAEMELWREILDAFNKEHPDIKIELEHVPYSAYFSKIQTMMAAGIPPDAIFIGPMELRGFVGLDAMLPLDDFIKNDKGFRKTDYYPAALNPYIINSKLYGLPNDVAVWAVIYNKDLFDKAGVDYPKANWTWQDFLVKSKAINKINPDGAHATFGCIFGSYELWMWQNKGNYYDNNFNPKKSIFDSKANRQTFTFLHDLIYKHKVAPTQSEAQSLGSWFEAFKTGRLGMYITGHWEVPQLHKVKTIRWDIAELPKGKIKANFSGGSCFCIPKKAKHPEQAFKLIKFITGEKGQVILTKGGFSTPALRTKKITELFLSAPENNKAFLDAMAHLKDPIFMPGAREMYDKIWREVDLFYLDKQSVDEMLKKVDKILTDFLKEKEAA